MSKFKKFLIIVPCLLLLVFTMFFSFIPINRDNIVSRADEVSTTDYYVYNSGNFYIPIRRYGDTVSTNYVDFLLFSFSCSRDILNNVNIDLSSSKVYLFFNSYQSGGVYYNTTNVSSFSFSDNLVYNNSLVSRKAFYYTGNNVTRSSLFYVENNDFNCDVISVEFSSDNLSSVPPVETAIVGYVNTLTFRCSNGGYLKFTFSLGTPIPNIDVTQYLFKDQTLYYNTTFNNSDYYQNGYSAGYQNGLTDGNAQGYTSGYNAGNEVGYQNGYNQGLSDTNEYNFNNLFGAVLDAPLTVFSSLFNFTLLGVNLWSLMTGLFTLCFIIIIIKLCLGGK